MTDSWPGWLDELMPGVGGTRSSWDGAVSSQEEPQLGWNHYGIGVEEQWEWECHGSEDRRAQGWECANDRDSGDRSGIAKGMGAGWGWEQWEWEHNEDGSRMGIETVGVGAG